MLKFGTRKGTSLDQKSQYGAIMYKTIMYNSEGQDCVMARVRMLKNQALRKGNDRGQKVKCTKAVGLESR